MQQPQIKHIQTSIKVYSDSSQLTEVEQNLLHSARKACDTAYAPYSHFFVGVAALLENGEVITGSNQENAAYPSGLCAERVALFAAAAKYPGIKVLQMAIAARKMDSDQYLPITPCGGCRQVMVEYEELHQHPITLLMRQENGEIHKMDRVGDLLPLSFSMKYLEGK